MGLGKQCRPRLVRACTVCHSVFMFWWQHIYGKTSVRILLNSLSTSLTPFTQLLPTRVCVTNAGVNTYGADIHKVRKHAIYAFPSFLFLTLLFRLYVKEPFSEM